MSPVTLERRIEGVIRSQRERIRDSTSGRDIAVLVGNGITRLAMGLAKGGDFSWDQWLQECLSIAGAKVTPGYLRGLGYQSSEIFEYALHSARGQERARERERRIWRELWKRTTAIRLPNPIHRAVVELSNVLLTTNFDDLLEQVVLGRGSTLDARSLMRSKKWSRVTIRRGKDECSVYKLHGGFLRTDQRRTFADWYDGGKPWHSGASRGNGRGARNTIADKEQYEAIAFCESKKFQAIRKPVHQALRGKALVILGLALTGEEIVLSRLLAGLESPLVVVAVEPPLDPLWRYERWPRSTVLRIPLGLVSSPSTRCLAMLFALRSIAEDSRCQEAVPAIEEIVEEFVARAERDVAGQSPSDRYPRIVALGQASVNRIIGLEDAVAQERAFAPSNEDLPTWGPDKREKKGPINKRLFLAHVEAGGQALVPCLVWDALHVPSALVAKVYADDLGARIVRRLQRCEWLDFEWVMRNQQDRTEKAAADPTSEPERVPGGGKLQYLSDECSPTENATVVTWFGLRTILDSQRGIQHEVKLDIDGSIEEKRLSCFALGSPIVYATKPRWKEAERRLEGVAGTPPLVVYDSGGTRNLEAEQWVARSQGIIIASAYAALQWMIGEAEAAKQARDDRGRVWQVKRLLRALERGTSPEHLTSRGALGRLRAYVITAGEMGCFYWIRDASGELLGPRWAYVPVPPRLLSPLSRSNRVAKREAYREVRNGLGCGDVARAGFTASLLASMGYVSAEPSVEQIEYAVGWANWFGWQKVRYFAIDDYIEFLASSRKPIVDDLAHRGGALGSSQCFGRNTASPLAVKLADLCKPRGGLTEEARKWSDWLQCLYPRDSNDDSERYLSGTPAEDSRERWEAEIQLWREARGLDRTRK